jgi:crotonobetainyl-CoA:carnitine CoA-transferase CaiB-like acyl-CoA transferase
VDHPVLGPHRLTGIPFDIDGFGGEVTRAPLLGEHTAEVLAQVEPPGTSREASSTPPRAAGLLDGIRVLDLTQVWAGPYATRFLADMGADVIHIEGPAFPDAVRGVGRPGDERGFDKSTYFNEYNRNKRGLALDLHDGRGMDAFRKLVTKADVVIENWSVGVAERLGIGYEELRALNPRVVFAQMPPFGKTGPEANRVGFGPSIEQMGGLVALQGYEGGPPHRSGISYGDPNAGVVAAGAVALALYQREITGLGSHVVLRQRDNITGMVGEFMLAAQLGAVAPVRIGNRDPGMAPHGVFRCRDDSGRVQADAAGNPLRELTDTWVAIAVEDDAGWAALVAAVNDEALRDPRFVTLEGRLAAQDELDAAVERWTRSRDAEDVAAQLQATGVSAMPVFSPLMLVRDAHLAERRAYGTYDHPEAGVCGTMAPVWRLGRRPAGTHTMRPAPCFGEHNAAVLVELAGLSPGEVKDLEEAEVVVDAPK